MIIWDNQTLTVRADPYKSSWLLLMQDATAHGLNGAFTSTAGVGKLELRYELASKANDQFAKDQGVLLFASTDEISPFTISMGKIKPMYFIRFMTIITVNTVTGYTLIFSEMGKGAK